VQKSRLLFFFQLYYTPYDVDKQPSICFEILFFFGVLLDIFACPGRKPLIFTILCGW